MRIVYALALLCCLIGINKARAADSYNLNAGATLTITEHSVCAVVTNGLSSSIFIPTKSAGEWTSFRTNTPPGVTSDACDTTPNIFTFIDVTGANPSTATTSNIVTINGITTATPVSATNGAQFNINGGGWVTSGNITNGQTLQIRLTASGSFSTAVSTNVTVGPVTQGWSVTTRAANSCSNTTISWSPGCSVASGNMTHGEGKSVTNTASGYTGTRNLSCNDGTIGQSGGSCAATGPTCGTFIASRRCAAGVLRQASQPNHAACKAYCEATAGVRCCSMSASTCTASSASIGSTTTATFAASCN
ncbi:hypothetical protein [Hyphomicrobium nitrativorans]|uniref:hypothetical protein n=1 Tax=Hyphomicrobium nitrativorans TaxID=1427356 RepID=UPI001182C01B|nr:hypothetical protein [Hyphomicrobium nitrativorans]